MKALRVRAQAVRYAAAAVAGRVVPGAGRPLRPAPAATTSTRPSCPDRTGCASGPASRASAGPTSPPSTARRRADFEPIVSFPFVPGHEVVGDDDGTRVVLVPVLRCVDPGHRPALHARAPRAGSATASTSPSAISSPASRPGTARHRRRLVGGDGGPPQPAPRRPRRLDRRGRGDGRAGRVRRPRRPPVGPPTTSWR